MLSFHPAVVCINCVDAKLFLRAKGYVIKKKNFFSLGHCGFSFPGYPVEPTSCCRLKYPSGCEIKLFE